MNLISQTVGVLGMRVSAREERGTAERREISCTRGAGTKRFCFCFVSIPSNRFVNWYHNLFRIDYRRNNTGVMHSLLHRNFEKFELDETAVHIRRPSFCLARGTNLPPRAPDAAGLCSAAAAEAGCRMTCTAADVRGTASQHQHLNVSAET